MRYNINIAFIDPTFTIGSWVCLYAKSIIGYSINGSFVRKANLQISCFTHRGMWFLFIHSFVFASVCHIMNLNFDTCKYNLKKYKESCIRCLSINFEPEYLYL